MKRLFLSLALLLTLCTSARAQFDDSLTPLITDHPTRTNWARWELTKTHPDGSQSVYFAAYDTLPNVIEYGKTLYREGGYIGDGRVPRNEEYYTDEVRDFMETQGYPMHLVRQAIIGNMTAKGSTADNVMVFDTSTNAELVGVWDIQGRSCGMPDDVITVAVADNTNANVVFLQASAPNDFGTWTSPITNLGPGVVAIESPIPSPAYENPVTFGEIVTIVQVNENEWRGPFGCKWSRQTTGE